MRDISNPLVYAAKEGHREIINDLIRNGVDLNQEDPALGLTPILAAIVYKQTNTIKQLIEAKCEINSTNNYVCLFNFPLGDLEVSNCVLQQITNKDFNRNNAQIHIIETICDQEVKGYTFEIISHTSLTFKVQSNISCSFLQLNENKKLDISHSMNLFSILVLHKN